MRETIDKGTPPAPIFFYSHQKNREQIFVLPDYGE